MTNLNDCNALTAATVWIKSLIQKPHVTSETRDKFEYLWFQQPLTSIVKLLCSADTMDSIHKVPMHLSVHTSIYPWIQTNVGWPATVVQIINTPFNLFIHPPKCLNWDQSPSAQMCCSSVLISHKTDHVIHIIYCQNSNIPLNLQSTDMLALRHGGFCCRLQLEWVHWNELFFLMTQ